MNISFWQKFLHQKEFVVVLTVDFGSCRLDEMDAAGVPWADTPTDTIKERWRHADAEIAQ